MRRHAGPSYCSRISDDIALESDALSWQWQSRVTLQPTRTNYANEFRTARPLLMSDWHVHSGYIERRNASRLSVHHDRIDDRVSSATPFVPPPLPSRPVGRIGRVSSRPRVSLAFFLPTAYCAASAISVYIDTRSGYRIPSGLPRMGAAWRSGTSRTCSNGDIDLPSGGERATRIMHANKHAREGRGIK